MNTPPAPQIAHHPRLRTVRCHYGKEPPMKIAEYRRDVGRSGLGTQNMTTLLEPKTVHPHWPECSQPTPYTFPGRFGDQMTGCRTCGKVTPAPPSTEIPPAPEEPMPHTGYVCRDHYRPVNWRGRGCPDCDRERSTR